MVSQEQANYRRGDPIDSCGTCVYFNGNIEKTCTQVDGEISHYGISDVYKSDRNNPFGPSMTPQDVAAVKQIAARAAQRNGMAGAMMQQQQPGDDGGVDADMDNA